MELVIEETEGMKWVATAPEGKGKPAVSLGPVGKEKEGAKRDPVGRPWPTLGFPECELSARQG